MYFLNNENFDQLVHRLIDEESAKLRIRVYRIDELVALFLERSRWRRDLSDLRSYIRWCIRRARGGKLVSVPKTKCPE